MIDFRSIIKEYLISVGNAGTMHGLIDFLLNGILKNDLSWTVKRKLHEKYLTTATKRCFELWYADRLADLKMGYGIVYNIIQEYQIWVRTSLTYSIDLMKKEVKYINNNTIISWYKIPSLPHIFKEYIKKKEETTHQICI